MLVGVDVGHPGAGPARGRKFPPTVDSIDIIAAEERVNGMMANNNASLPSKTARTGVADDAPVEQWGTR